MKKLVIVAIAALCLCFATPAMAVGDSFEYNKANVAFNGGYDNGYYYDCCGEMVQAQAVALGTGISYTGDFGNLDFSVNYFAGQIQAMRGPAGVQSQTQTISANGVTITQSQYQKSFGSYGYCD